MAKEKLVYVCTECGGESSKWVGQCPSCEAWNTLKEFKTTPAKAARLVGYTGLSASTVQPLAEVNLEELPRVTSGYGELDRVLGGGLVPGSVLLIGGDPGIGKSSLLLQVMGHLCEQHKALYVTGEESGSQVAMRASRMELPMQQLHVLTEVDVQQITQLAIQFSPKFMVIDSIQTMQLAHLPSAAGSVAQIREAAAAFTRLAKQHGITIFLVGHVTKSGEVAGPKVLEHIVDAVIYLEGERDSRYRTLRALKNRFGAVNELGVFAMTDTGMKEVKNPSAIFLNQSEVERPGSLVVSLWEGSRPILIEIQALVDQGNASYARRVCLGFEQNRLVMLLAVLSRHVGIQTYDQDVFVNVVGGIKISETSADLAIVLAVLSSLKGKSLPSNLIVFGEIGLSGELRPVRSGVERLQEAQKHGFTKAIVPKANMPKKPIKGMEIHAVSDIQAAVAWVL